MRASKIVKDFSVKVEELILLYEQLSNEQRDIIEDQFEYDSRPGNILRNLSIVSDDMIDIVRQYNL